MLLDTCALLWWTTDLSKLSESVQRRIRSADKVYVAAISIGEIATKVRKNKLDLPGSMREYLRRLNQISNLEIVAIDAALWVAASELKWANQDPADRLIVALAQRLGTSIVTKDKLIKKFYPNVVA
jgi:PIN domain nuclease of toxin-antitoxin system